MKNFQRLLVSLFVLGFISAAMFTTVYAQTVPNAGTLSGFVGGIPTPPATSKPLPGAEITLKPTAYGYGTHDYLATANEQGIYKIENIITEVYTSGGQRFPVSYTVTATYPLYADATWPVSFENSPFQYTDFGLRPVNAIAVEGTVVSANQTQPLSGITVTLKPDVYAYGTHDYTAVTDAAGHFLIPNVLRYTSSSGGTITWVKYTLNVLAAAGYADYAGTAFDLQQAPTPAEIVLTPLGLPRFSGTVFNRGNNEPVADATVTLKPTDRFPGAATYQQKTNSNGYFEINNILQQIYDPKRQRAVVVTYGLTVAHEGYDPYDLRRSLSFPDDKNYTLRIGLVQRITNGLIQGIVSDSKTGTPLEGARVVLRPNCEEVCPPGDSQTTTNVNGYYEFKNFLAAPSYDVMVARPGYQRANFDNVVLDNKNMAQQDVSLIKKK